MPSKILIKKLDIVFGKYITSLGYCTWCKMGKGIYQMHWAHIFGRKFMSTRWSRENSLCLCSLCHQKAHKNPDLFREWVISFMGEDSFEKLELKHNQFKKWTDEELKNLIKKYL